MILDYNIRELDSVDITLDVDEILKIDNLPIGLEYTDNKIIGIVEPLHKQNIPTELISNNIPMTVSGEEYNSMGLVDVEYYDFNMIINDNIECVLRIYKNHNIDAIEYVNRYLNISDYTATDVVSRLELIYRSSLLIDDKRYYKENILDYLLDRTDINNRDIDYVLSGKLYK